MVTKTGGSTSLCSTAGAGIEHRCRLDQPLPQRECLARNPKKSRRHTGGEGGTVSRPFGALGSSMERSEDPTAMPVDRRRMLCLTGAALAGGSVWLLGGRRLSAATEETYFFRIGTGPTSGNYFSIGGVIANAISNPPGSRPCDKGGSCGVPGLIAIAQTTQGSVQNVDFIAEKSLESGMCQSDVSYWAYSGSGMYKGQKPVDGLRAIANLYQESLHILVRADSAIKSIADLRGKRISLGERGAGTRA